MNKYYLRSLILGVVSLFVYNPLIGQTFSEQISNTTNPNHSINIHDVIQLQNGNFVVTGYVNTNINNGFFNNYDDQSYEALTIALDTCFNPIWTNLCRWDTNNRIDDMHDIVQLDNGNIKVIGGHRFEQGSNFDQLISDRFMDPSNGNVLQERFFGTTTLPNPGCNSCRGTQIWHMNRSANSDLVLSGFRWRDYTFVSAPLLMRHQQNGNILWQSLYEPRNSISNIHNPNCGWVGGVESQGDLFMIGVGSESNIGFIMMSRLDAGGTPIWSRAYRTSPNYNRYYGLNLVRATNNEFILLAQIGKVNSTPAMLIARMDANGSILWSKTIAGVTGREENLIKGNSLINAIDGNYIAAFSSTSFGSGPNDHDIVLVKFDDNGNLIWSNKYGQSGREEQVLVIRPKNDNTGYFVGGNIYTPDKDGWLFDISDATGKAICDYDTLDLSFVDITLTHFDQTLTRVNVMDTPNLSLDYLAVDVETHKGCTYELIVPDSACIGDTLLLELTNLPSNATVEWVIEGDHVVIATTDKDLLAILLMDDTLSYCAIVNSTCAQDTLCGVLFSNCCTPPIAYFNAPDSLCTYDSLTVFFGGAYYYQWIINGIQEAVFNADPDNVFGVVPGWSAGVYSVKLVAAWDSLFLCSDTVERYFFVKDCCDSFKVDLTVSDTVFCSQDTVCFTLTGSGSFQLYVDTIFVASGWLPYQLCSPASIFGTGTHNVWTFSYTEDSLCYTKDEDIFIVNDDCACIVSPVDTCPELEAIIGYTLYPNSIALYDQSIGNPTYIEWYIEGQSFLQGAGDTLFYNFTESGRVDICLSIHYLVFGSDICCVDHTCICVIGGVDTCDILGLKTDFSYNINLATPYTYNFFPMYTTGQPSPNVSIWNFGDGAVEHLNGSPSPVVHSFDSSGFYNVTLTQIWYLDGKYCCIDTQTYRIFVSPLGFRVMAYPNPYKNTVTFDFRISENSKVSIEITDSYGKMVASIIDNKVYEDGFYRQEFDLSNLANGMYNYRFKTADYNYTGKLIKQ